MADAEPSNAELARRLDGITVLLQQVVGRPEYNADERLREHRFTEVERDVDDLKRALNDAVKTILERMDRHEEDHKQREQETRKQRGTDWRQAVYSGIMPFAVGIALMLITTLVTKGGGK